MEFAWNTQKNKLTDVKGKEIEQERKSDNLKNEDIDRRKTHLNYDLIKSNLNLYQRVKKRIDEVRENSRIQKNSVVMYSNVITVNEETYKNWGLGKTKKYFEAVTEYFKHEFGEENIVSAKVHLDETAPHMHLQLVPVSSEGKLQAHKLMTKDRINKIHSDAPKWLQERGFEVERGKGKTGKKNIKDIYKYKAKKLEESVLELEDKIVKLNKELEQLEYEKRTKVENLEESYRNYKQHFFYAGQINNIATVEIEEGLFNKVKTDFLKVNKDDFNKLKECALKFVTQESIKSYLYSDFKRLEEYNKRLESEKKEFEEKYSEEHWSHKRNRNMLKIRSEEVRDLKSFINEKNMIDEYNIFLKRKENEKYNKIAISKSNSVDKGIEL